MQSHTMAIATKAVVVKIGASIEAHTHVYIYSRATCCNYVRTYVGVAKQMLQIVYGKRVLTRLMS